MHSTVAPGGDPPGPLFSPENRNHVPAEVVAANIKSAHARGLPLLERQADHRLPLAICGGAPSLAGYIEALKAAPIVWAVNKAHGYLTGCGVRVHGSVLVDAHPMLAELLTPRADCIYMVASQCAPEVFDALRDCRVYVWHAYDGDRGERELINSLWGAVPIMHGGNTAVLRSLNVGRWQGFRAFRMYGVDSSFSDASRQHAYAGNPPDLTGYITLRVRSTDTGLDVAFPTTVGLAAQTEWFRRIFREPWAWECDIQVHGQGLLPHVAREQNRIKRDWLRANGFILDLPPEHVVADDVISAY